MALTCPRPLGYLFSSLVEQLIKLITQTPLVKQKDKHNYKSPSLLLTKSKLKKEMWVVVVQRKGAVCFTLTNQACYWKINLSLPLLLSHLCVE